MDTDVPKAATASSGAATTGIESKNKATCTPTPLTNAMDKTKSDCLTAQNTRGVRIHVLYGLSKLGSLTRKTTKPKTYKMDAFHYVSEDTYQQLTVRK